MRSTTRHLRGFALVSAIFILVVLAALGAFIVNISTSQQIGSALDVQGVRAYQAARAGIEWGLYQVQATTNYNFSYGTTLPLAVGNGLPNDRRCPGGVSPSTNSFNPGAATLTGFRVTVRCTAIPDSYSGPTIYTITSTACSQPNASNECPNTSTGADAPGNLYIERRLEVAF